jgi:hypothetical protein
MPGIMGQTSKHPSVTNPETTREEFPDGSALVTYQDGSVLILESKLAKGCALREGRRANYNDPAPSPVAGS